MSSRIKAGLLGILLAILAFETCCQVYSLYLARRWEAVKASPGHYFERSPNPKLAYQLAKGFSLRKHGRRLSINRFGIRDQSNEIPTGPTIALLGDSVVFGIGLSQEQTISALLQRDLDRSGTATKVLNFGVPGYGLAELLEHLKVTTDAYDVDHLIYILNPNDFARRDTVYEGADAGLYRMYRRPRFKSPWFLRKLAYRLNKYDSLADHRRLRASVDWYEWLFAGGKQAAYGSLTEMASFARRRSAAFTVVLLPAGVAYDRDGTYRLTDIHQELSAFLETNEITYLDTVDGFSSNVGLYFDQTDHLTENGNRRMSQLLREHLVSARLSDSG